MQHFSESPGTLPSDWRSATDTLQHFLEASRAPERKEKLVALHDTDADGVAAGVVWQRACERLGFEKPARILPGRERNAWDVSVRKRVEATHASTLFVMDLGSQSVPVLNGVPTCFIDHHRPEGVPPGDVLISGYDWNPIPNTSLMVYELFGALVNIQDLDWVAAIGTFSDLGEKAPFDLVNLTRKKYTAKYLKEATALVNAIRRSSTPDAEIAAQALLKHENPKDLVMSASPEVQQLKAAREEVKAALEQAKKAAPVFSKNVALIRISSPCQVHPLIAQIWRTRLPKYIVIAANDSYLPNRVNFSARATGDTNVLQFLRSIEISEGEGNYGHGHDAASGGSLPPERWNEFLQKLGFDT